MSFVDTTKIASDDILVAMTSKVKQMIYPPTHDTKTSMSGTLSFERIHPRSIDFTISDLKIYFKGTFTITLSAALTDTTVPTFRLENINSALYHTMIDINGNITPTSQPYINYLIRKQYDKNYYQEEQQMKHDKDVWFKITHTGGSADATKNKIFEVQYECLTPLMVPEIESDLTGINNLNITSQVNLYNIFKFPTISNISKIEVKDVEYRIRYNEIHNTIIQESYSAMVNSYLYYKGDVGSKDYIAGNTQTIETSLNIRDGTSQPLIVYVVNAPHITEISTKICLAPEIKPISCSFDINSDTNTMLSQSTHDIYYISKNAGLLTEYNTWTGKKDNLITDARVSTRGLPCPPVIACNMLKTNESKISTSDIFRLNVNATYDYTYNENINGIDRDCYAVYSYPSIYYYSSSENRIIKNLTQTFAELIEMDDDDAYFRQLADSGVLSGGGKVGDFFKNLWRKIKSGKFISKALNFIGNTKNANNLLSMIPGVGAAMPIISKIQDIAGEAGKTAENAGYGVSMF